MRAWGPTDQGYRHSSMRPLLAQLFTWVRRCSVRDKAGQILYYDRSMIGDTSCEYELFRVPRIGISGRTLLSLSSCQLCHAPVINITARSKRWVVPVYVPDIPATS
jgi:hypothetical protein